MCTKCEQSLFGFVICKDYAEASPVCVCFVCVNEGPNVRVCVCRISLSVCVFVTASVQVHGEMLFTASSAARRHDGSQHRGGNTADG